jgi:hypothetical protein
MAEVTESVISNEVKAMWAFMAQSKKTVSEKQRCRFEEQQT